METQTLDTASLVSIIRSEVAQLSTKFQAFSFVEQALSKVLTAEETLAELEKKRDAAVKQASEVQDKAQKSVEEASKRLTEIHAKCEALAAQDRLDHAHRVELSASTLAALQAQIPAAQDELDAIRNQAATELAAHQDRMAAAQAEFDRIQAIIQEAKAKFN